jgi:hypothetical protein
MDETEQGSQGRIWPHQLAKSLKQHLSSADSLPICNVSCCQGKRVAIFGIW